MYFTLINDLRFESGLWIHDPSGLPPELDFIAGKSITTPIAEPLVYTTNARRGDTLRDFLRGSFPLISKRFLAALQAAGVENLETFPAVVESTGDGWVWRDYVGLNIVGAVACADLARSTYSEIMPGHYRFSELAIHADAAKGALLFRLAEHLSTIIIHRRVGRHLKYVDPDGTDPRPRSAGDAFLGWSVGRLTQ